MTCTTLECLKELAAFAPTLSQKRRLTSPWTPVPTTGVPDKTLNYRAFRMRFNAALLRTFVDQALESNVSYFASRRHLYTLFTSSIDREGAVELDNSVVITIRTFLSNRDNNPADSARLAYEVAIMTIFELVG